MITIIGLICLVIAIVTVAALFRSRSAYDTHCYVKRPDRDITEEAWFLEMKKRNQGETHTSKLAGRKSN